MESETCPKTEKSQFENIPNENKIYPSLEDLMIGFSLALNAKIIEDLESKDSTHSPANETFFNEEHLMGYLNTDLKDIPSSNQIYSWTFSLYHSASLSEECLMLTLIYIVRVLKRSGIKLFAGNWQMIVVAATLTSLRVCDVAYHCSLQLENLFTRLSFDELFELNDEFSHLIQSKYEANLSSFQICFEILGYPWEKEKQKSWKLNLEKINKIIRKSKTFDEVEEDRDPRIIKSGRMYNIDMDQYDFDN